MTLLRTVVALLVLDALLALTGWPFWWQGIAAAIVIGMVVGLVGAALEDRRSRRDTDRYAT